MYISHIPDGLRGRHALTLNSPHDFNFLNYLAKEKKPYKSNTVFSVMFIVIILQTVKLTKAVNGTGVGPMLKTNMIRQISKPIIATVHSNHGHNFTTE